MYCFIRKKTILIVFFYIQKCLTLYSDQTIHFDCIKNTKCFNYLKNLLQEPYLLVVGQVDAANYVFEQ